MSGKVRNEKLHRVVCLVTIAFLTISMVLLAPQFIMHVNADEEYEGSNDELIREASEALKEIAAERPIPALIYLTAEYSIKAAPDINAETTVKVPSGQTVNIEDATIVFTEDGYEVWEYVSTIYENKEYTGYVNRYYLLSTDYRFDEWEDEFYYMNPQKGGMTMAVGDGASPADAEAVFQTNLANFPESYRDKLTALHNTHPTWIFVPYITSKDWNTVIRNEIGDKKSVVWMYSTKPYLYEGIYKAGQWGYASEATLKHYMDPRNGLDDNTIFQFEQLTYNNSYHTLDAVEKCIRGTFMDNVRAPGSTKTYAQLLYDLGVELGISPVHLAARIVQEQGVDGRSELISGTNAEYPGYYNYFNVGATGQTSEEEIRTGLATAASRGWNTAEASIRGGAQVICSSYVNTYKQDTLYLQKFNVTNNSTYSHQYMQNIGAPMSEASKIKKSYNESSMLESQFVFKIPVYLNMDESCPMPTSSTNVTVQVPAGYSTDKICVDGVEYTPVKRNGQCIVTVPDGTGTNVTAYKYNENSVPTGMYVWAVDYKNNGYTSTPQPELENLLSYHGFSLRIRGKSGIRFKTGISAGLRSELINSGVNGYKLKEYGTLAMYKSNLGPYPLVKGGAKIISDYCYGDGPSGFRDNIFETVDGRHRFTGVLNGLPASEYKKEFAFRAYITLEKNGKETTIYSPIVYRSIYNLAQQYISAGTYAQGTEGDAFLQSIIRDAQ